MTRSALLVALLALALTACGEKTTEKTTVPEATPAPAVEVVPVPVPAPAVEVVPAPAPAAEMPAAAPAATPAEEKK
ncbi:MAG: hypothetical protein H7Z18_07660 [Methylophilaceae bacterium]|nr:hypothetical protein [Methylophilaceae bacterium]